MGLIELQEVRKRRGGEDLEKEVWRGKRERRRCGKIRV